MIMIDDYFKPEKILSYVEARTIGTREYTMLKQIGQIERDYVLKKYLLPKEPELSIKSIVESRLNDPKYDNLSNLKKEVVLANSILPDDIKIIDILTKEGFTLQHLKTIIKFRSILKNLLINKTMINKELKEQIAIYKRVMDKLIDVFYKNFNFKDSTTILNRITELLVTSPNLFDKKIDDNKLTKSPK